MALTITQLFTPFQLSASAAVLYTVPASPATTVLKNGRIRLTNTSALPVAVTLHADAGAAPSAAGNMFLSAVSVAANSSIDLDLPTMRAGDTLRGFAATGSVITVHEAGGTLFS